MFCLPYQAMPIAHAPAPTEQCLPQHQILWRYAEIRHLCGQIGQRGAERQRQAHDRTLDINVRHRIEEGEHRIRNRQSREQRA